MIPMLWKKTVLLWVVVLSACTIQLAPSYDQALVEGLDASHIKALSLFAALENGSAASEFDTYALRYSDVLVEFEALRERASARAIPPLARRLSRTRFAQSFCSMDVEPASANSCVNASPASIARAIEVVRTLRDRHRRGGVTAEAVAFLRRDYSTAIAQAITVENALKR